MKLASTMQLLIMSDLGHYLNEDARARVNWPINRNDFLCDREDKDAKISITRARWDLLYTCLLNDGGCKTVSTLVVAIAVDLNWL